MKRQVLIGLMIVVNALAETPQKAIDILIEAAKRNEALKKAVETHAPDYQSKRSEVEKYYEKSIVPLYKILPRMVAEAHDDKLVNVILEFVTSNANTADEDMDVTLAKVFETKSDRFE